MNVYIYIFVKWFIYIYIYIYIRLYIVTTARGPRSFVFFAGVNNDTHDSDADDAAFGGDER